MESLFYILCTTLPSHIIPFALFWNFRWRSRKAALFWVCMNVLCKMLVAAHYIANGILFRNMELVFALLGFGVYLIFLQLDPFKMLFTYILIVDYLLIVRGISSFLAVRILETSAQGWASSLFCILLYCVTLPLLIGFFRRVANQVYHTHAPQLWRSIWLIPGLFTALTLIFTNSYLESNVQGYLFLVSRLGLLVCVFAIYHVLLQTLESFQKQIALEQQLVFEKRMTEIVGPAGGRLHTGHSRNDQTTTSTKMCLRHEIREVQKAVRLFVDTAERHLDVIMPSYTHMQNGQPQNSTEVTLCTKKASAIPQTFKSPSILDQLSQLLLTETTTQQSSSRPPVRAAKDSHT